MFYAEHLPHPALRPLVACFWEMATPLDCPLKPLSRSILPDGCADIIFDFTGVRGRSPSYVVGTMTTPAHLTISGAVDMLGIRFRPGAARVFLQAPMIELTDQAPDLQCFWKHTAPALYDRLGATRDIRARIAILEDQLLLRSAQTSKPDAYVQYCVSRMQNSPCVALSDLIRGTGLGLRQIERRFRQEVGVGPKSFSRIVRFMSVASQAKSVAAPDWAQIAFANGYSDQSHMARDFRAFSGLSPSAFIAEH